MSLFPKSLIDENFINKFLLIKRKVQKAKTNVRYFAHRLAHTYLKRLNHLQTIHKYLINLDLTKLKAASDSTPISSGS